MHKIKTLALSTYDSPYLGHGATGVKLLIETGFDAKLVALYSPTGGKEAIFPGKILGKIDGITTRLFNWLHLGVFGLVVKGTYHGFSESSSPVTAKQILRKYGDKPDLICLYWIDRFISAKVLADLKRLTNAKIAMICVDQYMIAGACHYMVDCEQWKTGCYNCPALPDGCGRAAQILKEREELLTDIIDYVIGIPSDCSLAMSTKVYKNAKTFFTMTTPNMDNTVTKSAARKEFGVYDDDFVVMFASASLSERRKGFVYFREAMLDISSRHPQRRITVLMPGKDEANIEGLDNSIEIRSLGFLDMTQLSKVYRACDVFVSTTIADSGPMMVNFSIAAGRPVVSFPVGIAQDIVIPGSTGYLAEMKNAHDVANGIIEYYAMDKTQLGEVENACFGLMDKYRGIPHWRDRLFEEMQNELNV